MLMKRKTLVGPIVASFAVAIMVIAAVPVVDRVVCTEKTMVHAFDECDLWGMFVTHPVLEGITRGLCIELMNAPPVVSEVPVGFLR